VEERSRETEFCPAIFGRGKACCRLYGKCLGIFGINLTGGKEKNRGNRVLELGGLALGANTGEIVLGGTEK